MWPDLRVGAQLVHVVAEKQARTLRGLAQAPADDYPAIVVPLDRIDEHPVGEGAPKLGYESGDEERIPHLRKCALDLRGFRLVEALQALDLYHVPAILLNPLLGVVDHVPQAQVPVGEPSREEHRGERDRAGDRVGREAHADDAVLGQLHDEPAVDMPIRGQREAVGRDFHGVSWAWPGASCATSDRGWIHEGPSIACPGASIPTAGSHFTKSGTKYSRSTAAASASSSQPRRSGRWAQKSAPMRCPVCISK